MADGPRQENGMTRTIHLIGNAHLDPVWLWRREAGIDAAIATARSACDRLDEYPEFVFTASSSWFHRQVERCDPELLERVRRHVAAGRWRLVGGMVIEPDCNLPSAESLARQLRYGQAYFGQQLGQPCTVGYNIDSFGHTAYLPRLLREAGLDSYVFMRPGPHEMELPGQLFRWRSPDGAEVVAFRILDSYNLGGPDLTRHIERAVERMTAEGLDHTMVFFGVGDHGGGPTKAQIEWIVAHANAFDGVRLVISHPRAFFDAVAGRTGSLPVVAGELQHHAIGCYSVERRIKVSMRRAEAALVRAERTVNLLAGRVRCADAAERIDRAWEKVLFNEFHDILGGTSLDAASETAAGEFAGAAAAADDLVCELTRRAFRNQAAPPVHKIIVVNPSDEPFAGLLCHQPFLEGRPNRGLTLLDDQDRPIACQAVESPAKVEWVPSIVFPMHVPAGGWRVLRLTDAAPPAVASSLRVEPGRLGNAQVTVDTNAGQAGIVCLLAAPGDCASKQTSLARPTWHMELEVLEDLTDTWSHSAGNRFAGERVGEFEWIGEWETVESGPVRTAMRRQAQFNHSRLWARLSVAEGDPAVRLHLSIVWAEAQRMLRLRLVGGEVSGRVDLVSGGPLARPIDGREYPIAGGLCVGAGPAGLSLVAPEVFSASVDEGGIALTLIRSPYVAHHDPFPHERRPDQPVTDQGRHEIEVILRPGAPDAAWAARQVRRELAGPIVFDVTG